MPQKKLDAKTQPVGKVKLPYPITRIILLGAREGVLTIKYSSRNAVNYANSLGSHRSTLACVYRARIYTRETGSVTKTCTKLIAGD